jgi:hypothetical protein
MFFTIFRPRIRPRIRPICTTTSTTPTAIAIATPNASYPTHLTDIFTAF